MNLLRALLPSWKFFETAGANPRLSYREENGEWIAFTSPKKRTWADFFLNAEWNFYLTQVSSIEKLTEEIQSMETENVDHLTRSASYLAVEEIVRDQLPKETKYQFRIELVEQLTGKTHELLISGLHD